MPGNPSQKQIMTMIACALIEHRGCLSKCGQDMPEITKWTWEHND